MTKHALVTGASIAGLTTAFWLARTGWTVDVVERFDRFRDGGQNVDVRGTAHEVLQRMGLTETVRSNTTTEEGTSFIGGRGQLLGGIPVDQEQDGPTAELEILRGDLARIILDATGDGVAVRYGDRIVTVRESGTQVDVEFLSGSTGTYDLLVIAEGVRSKTRELAFGDVHKRELGLNMAYGTISRISSDDRWWRWYNAPKRRGITLRPDNAGTTRATLAYVDRASNLAALPVDEAKARLATVFADAGWQAKRVTAGFIASEDVYVDYLTQITMSTWSKGRIVVTGDAAWCVTPLGGGGTSLALTGGYVLAAYLSQAPEGDFSAALRQYEQWMRPIVTAAQNLPKGTPELFYPNSAAGVRVLRTMEGVVTTRPLRRLAARFSHVARTDQPLPEVLE